ncbi:glutamine--tRNA ligase/YqeY domain fusion protein [Melittangium boletus]|uniref:glutamine--tRNA ligase/YqeY domain fusion protein n=1 Tax=Melittangium boletus TaxID=83453 RepID=UPI003DA2D045
MAETETKPVHFIRQIIAEDNQSGKFGGSVRTRFPPEPNGYLHIGHAKSIHLNHGMAVEHGGQFNMRFDDTNPSKEEQEYVDSILRDVKWVGADWGDRLFFASDYFEQMYAYAEQLIQKGKAFVCDLNAEQMREHRGTLTEPGRDSPFRERSVEENLDLFRRMRAGEFPDGARTLRAKIDMASPNFNLRDPVLYRIIHAHHHRQGDTWCIYPMYDWAHGIEDSIERITHSLCTLEFENHRPLYDWFLDQLGVYHPQQIEFSRLNLTYTVMSKRKLLELVQGKHVRGWDDPRMPTLSGLRRRGCTPEALRAFCEDVGVTKFDASIDVGRLENAMRDDLNRRSPRRLAVLRPLKLIIENFPEGQVEMLDAVNNPEDPSAGSRQMPFSRELYIEQDDFMENPPKKFFRLAPGQEVRLRFAFFVKCTGVEKDAAGHITAVRATYDPATRGGESPDGRKVKATIHWVSAAHAVDAEVRLFDRLFNVAEPDRTPKDPKLAATFNYKQNLNPNSLEVLRAKMEPALGAARADERFQFERLGYFCVDADTTPGAPVFNRTVTLKDTWAKEQAKDSKGAS